MSAGTRTLKGIFDFNRVNGNRRAPGSAASKSKVLQILVTGSSNKEIAGPLGIEARTVKSHVSHLMKKLGVTNRLAAAVEAVRQSIVSV